MLLDCEGSECECDQLCLQCIWLGNCIDLFSLQLISQPIFTLSTWRYGTTHHEKAQAEVEFNEAVPFPGAVPLPMLSPPPPPTKELEEA